MQNRSSRYLAAAAALIIAVLLRYLLDPVLGDQAPSFTIYAAVGVAVWVGGWRLAVVTAVIGFLACAWLFMPPRGEFALTDPRTLISLTAFGLVSAIVIVLGESRQAALQRLHAASRADDRWPTYRPLTLAQLGDRKVLRDPVAIVFAFAFAVLVVGGVAGYLSTRRLVDNERRVARSNGIIAALDAVLSTVKDAETGQRGYLLTGSASYAEPYTEAVNRLPDQMEYLRQLVADNSEQQARLTALDAVIQEKMAELASTVSAIQRGERETALDVVRDNSGKRLMDTARLRTSEMQAAERVLLTIRSSESHESLRLTLLAILLGSAMGLTLLAAAFYIVQRNLQERRQAAMAIADQRERFRVTLASIGDAVITTDVDGSVTYLNPMAEAVTGWSTQAAIGMPLSSVFHIISETTHKPVENPAVRALREGVIVGLANHTLLIRKDGSECPIDDSAAPIRSEDGTITGCVLIFRDISDRRLMEIESLKQVDAARFLVSIVESSEDAIIGVSLDGMIQTWNEAAQRLYGYQVAEAVNQPIAMLIPADRPNEEERLIQRIIAGERISHFDTVRVDRQGRMIPVSLTISAVRDDEGRIVGTSKIVRDITESKDAERRIYSLLAELKAADERKDEFLAILAHELRNPLAPIKHLLEVIKLSGDDRELRQQSVATMDRQLSQMVRLVDDLLDVSRITRNKLELRPEPVEIVDVLNQAIENVHSYAEAQGHRVMVELSSESLKVNADPVRLAQVFGNLLQNAYKYTESGGTVWLTAHRKGNDVHVIVRDNGIGITPELLPRIFDLFTQANRAIERSQGGLGIGLTLVKQLVGIHGGSIEVKSDGIGKGSEFLVCLPLLIGSVATPVAKRMQPARVAPRRVLVVDDNTDSADSLVTLLGLLGHETAIAYDGLTAVEVAEQFRPQLVLLDLGLPRLNGFEVCAMIRKQPWGAESVLVAVSGWGQEADRKKTKDAGFDHHLVKPLDYPSLLQLLGGLKDGQSETTG